MNTFWYMNSSLFNQTLCAKSFQDILPKSAFEKRNLARIRKVYIISMLTTHAVTTAAGPMLVVVVPPRSNGHSTTIVIPLILQPAHTSISGGARHRGSFNPLTHTRFGPRRRRQRWFNYTTPWIFSWRSFSSPASSAPPPFAHSIWMLPPTVDLGRALDRTWLQRPTSQ